MWLNGYSMKEIVWVIGSSSSGKSTFMRRIMEDKALAAAFGWQGKTVAVCQRSLDFPGDLGLPEIVAQRHHILDDSIGLLKTADVVLIKWQYVDSSCELPQKLRAALPGVRHRIILLYTNDTELIRRLRAKDWWLNLGFGSAEELLGYEKQMVPKFRRELKDFAVLRVNASNQTYRILDSH